MLLPESDGEGAPTQQQEVSTEVYDNYVFEHGYDETLPITDERQHVVQTIESNRVTVIQGIFILLFLFFIKNLKIIITILIDF